MVLTRLPRYYWWTQRHQKECTLKSCILVLSVFLIFYTPISLAGPLCALASGSYSPNGDQQPPPMANQQMAEAHAVLCSRFSCPNYSLFMNGSAGNAQAYLGQSGGQIRYQPNFMDSVLNQFGPQATIGILSHELGHLIDFYNNPNPNISQYDREAAADEYAGCAFALAGAPPFALTALQNTLFAMGSSPGYPNSNQRANLISSGYSKCSN